MLWSKRSTILISRFIGPAQCISYREGNHITHGHTQYAAITGESCRSQNGKIMWAQWIGTRIRVYGKSAVTGKMESECTMPRVYGKSVVTGNDGEWVHDAKSLWKVCGHGNNGEWVHAAECKSKMLTQTVHQNGKIMWSQWISTRIRVYGKSAVTGIMEGECTLPTAS